jgi:tagatose 6-phosphate kinase
MILCVNPNAAIDKTVIVSPFELGKIHRPQGVKSLPGGKGCNVARALKTLGETPVVTGWVGGTAGQFIENGLHAEDIQTDFVHVDFESRTCLSIVDGPTITEIYELGEPIPPPDVAAMRDHFRAIVGGYDAVTFSGSLPPGVPADFYRDLIRIANEAGVPTFLDSSKDPLRLGVEAQPFLVKPNEQEAAILTGREIHTVVDCMAAAQELTRRYRSIVVISLGPEGAVAARRDDTLHVRNPKVDAKSAVGSGDCTLAGLAYGFTHGFAFEDALKHGIAAGTANTLTIGAGTFTMDDFERVRAQVTVTRKD